jgi:hypothetical protein
MFLKKKTPYIEVCISKSVQLPLLSSICLDNINHVLRIILWMLIPKITKRSPEEVTLLSEGNELDTDTDD